MGGFPQPQNKFAKLKVNMDLGSLIKDTYLTSLELQLYIWKNQMIKELVLLVPSKNSLFFMCLQILFFQNRKKLTYNLFTHLKKKDFLNNNKTKQKPNSTQCNKSYKIRVDH